MPGSHSTRNSARSVRLDHRTMGAAKDREFPVASPLIVSGIQILMKYGMLQS